VTAIAILQARVGSTRLPGKVLMNLAGAPLLVRVIERARAIPGLDRVVLATTTAERDRPLINLARQHRLAAYAGSEDDVLDRYYQTARHFEADVIVRLTADCPLLDPAVSAQVLDRFGQGGADYVSNTQPPTYPDGLDTEVFSFAALEQAWHEATLSSEREHVTPYIWKHPDKFRLASVINAVDLSALRWTVDEAPDLEFVRAVYAQLYRAEQPLFNMQDVLTLLVSQAQLQDTQAYLKRNAGYLKSINHDKEITRYESR
jgi:spore coat polysaccharide biosynthesis protein SpsF